MATDPNFSKCVKGVSLKVIKYRNKFILKINTLFFGSIFVTLLVFVLSFFKIKFMDMNSLVMFYIAILFILAHDFIAYKFKSRHGEIFQPFDDEFIYFNVDNETNDIKMIKYKKKVFLDEDIKKVIFKDSIFFFNKKIIIMKDKTKLVIKASHILTQQFEYVLWVTKKLGSSRG